MSPEDVSVDIQGKVDDEKTGKYILTYAADYRGMHAEAQRIVRVVDTVCPEIILAPDTGGTLLPGTPYQEAGYRAIDNYDGDITDRVVRSEEYGKIIYAVTDSSGNPGYAEREVPYYDPIPPEITLEGDADMAITTGTFYQEPGYSALDNVDGDLTQQVQVDGEVDWLTPGTYSVTYTVTDGYKNTTTVTRTVEVQAVPRPEVVWPEGKVIYLTFDDGPSPAWTPRLLEGLSRRGARATFFLVGSQIEGREDLVRRIRQEGHQIGSHSFSHRALTELSTADALADLEKCDRALRQVLGDGSYWLRPPYGFLSDRELCALGTPVICWSVDTEDWKSRDVDSILDIVLRRAGDGDILLLHDCYATSVTAALEIVDRLQPRGVRFVTVEELFAVKGVEPACGTLYHRVREE